MAEHDVWAFDVDGALVDLLGGQTLRPHAHALLSELRRRGHVIVVWSAGGADYARRKAAATGIDALVDAYYDKAGRDDDGRRTAGHFAAGHRPTVFVDDAPEEVPARGTALGVRPFLAPGQHDTVFADLIEDLDRR
ncbi:MAG TPA: haloacid dehalogenase-like hydrolase [Trebonia sp.]|jgi:phosphoglycolate phosphatase-like HAD superfamily hydrolase